MNWNLSRLLRLGLLLLFLFVFGLCCLFVFLVFALCLLSGRVFVTTYWTVYRSFTSSLLRPLNQQTAIFAPINHAT